VNVVTGVVFAILVIHEIDNLTLSALPHVRDNGSMPLFFETAGFTMKCRILGIAPFLALLLMPMPGAAQTYSVREVGFVDVDVKPYRLIVMTKDSKSLEAEKKRLGNEFADSNIVLVAQTAGPKTLTPLKKPVGDLSKPRWWLVAPDNRALAIDGQTRPGDLLDSPLRKQIQHELTSLLSAVVLLESKDQAANEKMRRKAEAVLEQVNRIRRNLNHAPDADVILLTLPVADRARERWTLWGLGEDVEANDMPKIAVLFGRMRRAGALFEGTDWRNDELFGRIVALGQACEDELDRKQFFDTPLPFKWAPDWSRHVELPFDPLDDKIKAELAAILQRPPLAERTPRRLTPGQFEFAPEVAPVVAEPVRPAAPAILATTEVGIAILVIGIVGWIALGLSVLYVENRNPRRSNSQKSA